MKQKFIGLISKIVLVLNITIIISFSTHFQELLAAEKTIEAFKSTDWSSKSFSDAKVLYEGVISYDSSYTGTYSETVDSSNFYSKSSNIKYWASHGNSLGELWGTNSNSSNMFVSIFEKPTFSWANGELEFVFLGACNQLNKEDNNPAKKYAQAMLGSKAVRVICGYHSFAPDLADYRVSQKFLEYAKTGESVKSSWIKANEYVYNVDGYTNCKNYAVLTHTGNAQYSRFPGFSSTTYPRPDLSSRTILRFRKGKENGEVFYMSPSSNKIGTSHFINKGKYHVSEKEIPRYRLKASNIDLNASESCEDIVFHDRDTLALNSGEIGNQAITLDESMILSKSQEYFQSNYTSSKEISFDPDNVEIEPITVSNIMDDGSSEKVVAYVTTYKQDFSGVPISGDNFTTIVDKEGVKFSVCQWHTLEPEKVDLEDDPVSLEEATDAVTKESSISLGANPFSLYENNFETLSQSEVSDVKLAYSFNSSSGYYEPVYQFTMKDATLKEVNCFTGDLIDQRGK